MKYLARVVSLIFLPKTLIWNKIKFRILNSLKFAELVVNEFTKSISKKLYQHLVFHPIYLCLLYRFQVLTIQERDNFSKIFNSIAFYL